MSKDDILTFFAIMGLFVVGVGVYAFGYFLGMMLFALGILIAFVVLVFFGILGSVVDEVSKQQCIAKREYDHAIQTNGGSIDGARMKLGDTEIYVEGPKNSFWKGMKYAFTGTEEYSTKFRIGGKEVGKIKVNSDGLFKFKWQ